MLESVKISRRQSEIRKELAVLVGKQQPSEDETRSMETLDKEYQSNETRFRAALITEDTERKEAKGELETRGEKDYAELVDKFELRQIALHFDEGRALDGATAEVVQELREQGGYRGVPVPWQALEKRTGETVASGTPSPKMTAPVIDRIFADSAAARMGAQMVNIAQGTQEYPITGSSVAAAWQTSETGSVGGPTAFSTAERSLAPNNTLGITMKITRKTLKQSGAGLEQAVRRDMNGCMGVAIDAAVFLGSGSSGEPNGVMKVGSPSTQTVYGSTITSVGAAASWSAFRSAIRRFMIANAVNSPSDVKLLIRPEVWDAMDDTLITSTAVSEWDRMVGNIGAENIVMSSNALAAPGGSPTSSNALLTTVTNGVAPIFVGTWGAIDLIRDVYTDAASGGLRLTALVTMDVSASRAEQLQILTGIQ